MIRVENKKSIYIYHMICSIEKDTTSEIRRDIENDQSELRQNTNANDGPIRH